MQQKKSESSAITFTMQQKKKWILSNLLLTEKIKKKNWTPTMQQKKKWNLSNLLLTEKIKKQVNTDP